jgi:predicted metal-dependent HD superfamily phosphohydrolase
MDLKRWNDLCRRLGCPDPADWFHVLEHAYSERHRHYHTAVHVQECLDLLDQAAEQPEHPDEVESAIWLHDAVYAPIRQDNEQQSAALALQWLRTCPVEEESLQRVRQLILTTRHAEEPKTPDEALIQDIDLGILGSPRERFQEYEEQVRREFRWVPGFIFRRRRREMLESFLCRKAVYHTPWFRANREPAARVNLTWAIEGRSTY